MMAIVLLHVNRRRSAAAKERWRECSSKP